MKEIKLSEPFALKLINGLFKEQKKRFITTVVNWLIDSRYRTYMRLDKFLYIQLYAVHLEVFNVAKQFTKYKNYDTRIVEILKWVKKNIRYQRDADNFGYNEKWAMANVILKRKKDDCDGLNSLVYILARLSGIPSYLLWNCIGMTKTEGHYWLLYLSPQRGKLYSIDATYKPNLSYIQYRQPFKLGTEYKLTWYLFNENFMFK